MRRPKAAAAVVVLTRAAGDNAALIACAQGAWTTAAANVSVRGGPRAARGQHAGPGRAAGELTVVELPCLRTEPVLAGAGHAALHEAVAGADGVVLASRHGATSFAALLAARRLTLPARCALLAVGPATAAAAERAFARPCAVAPVHHAEGLVAHALATFGDRSARLLLPAAEGGRRVLYEGLVAAGHRCLQVVTYRTVPAPPRTPRMTWDARLHYIVCASPSAVVGFCAQAEWPAYSRALSIGPTTSAALRAHGQPVAAEANAHHLPGLCRLLTHALEKL